MSVEKNPVRLAAVAGNCGIRIEEAGAGMVAADAYACAILWKEAELRQLRRGSEVYEAKHHVIHVLEKERAGILAQVKALGG